MDNAILSRADCRFQIVIGQYNSQGYGLASHITQVVCFNSIHEWRDLRSTTNDRIFEKLFSWQDLFSLRFFARNLLRGNRQRNIFFFIFPLFRHRPEIRTRALLTHYLPYYDDFQIICDVKLLPTICICRRLYALCPIIHG